jgi:hypothetical protein
MTRQETVKEIKRCIYCDGALCEDCFTCLVCDNEHEWACPELEAEKGCHQYHEQKEEPREEG